MPAQMKDSHQASVPWLRVGGNVKPRRREVPLNCASRRQIVDIDSAYWGTLVPRRTRSDHYTPRDPTGKEATTTFIQTIKVLDPCPAKVVQRSDLLATQSRSLDENAPAHGEDRSDQVRYAIAGRRPQANPPRIHSRCCRRICAPCRFEHRRVG